MVRNTNTASDSDHGWMPSRNEIYQNAKKYFHSDAPYGPDNRRTLFSGRVDEYLYIKCSSAFIIKSSVGPPSLNGTSKASKQENNSSYTSCERIQGTRYPITGGLMYHHRKACHSQFWTIKVFLMQKALFATFVHKWLNKFVLMQSVSSL